MSTSESEQQRLEALHAYEILDTPAEASFDELAELAARTCKTPTGLVTLIDEKRQWFKARFGFSTAETDRELSFCAHTIIQSDVMVVTDALRDPRFATNPLVTGEPGIRFYAGTPLVTPGGYSLGSLAVIDYKPRDLADDQRLALRTLGKQVVAQLELRRHMRDMSNRGARSEALRAALAESALDCVIAMDHDGRILEFNPAAEQTFGYRRADVIGKDLTMLIPPSLRDRHERALSRYLATGQQRNLGRRVELTAVRSNGDEFPIELSISRVPIEPPVFAGFVRDITERRRIQAQLLQSQKLEAMGQLAGGIAHDFNNMLAVMQCSAFKIDKTPENAEHVAEIVKAIERATSLTRQLLLVSRKQPLRNTLVDVDGVVRDMARMLQHVLGHGITLTTEFHGSLPPIRGDAGMLQQVLLNLLVNARDAMPDGGTLSLTTKLTSVAEPTSLHGLAVEPGDFVCLGVRDTGGGIPADVLPNIFEPFFTTKEPGKGTGLGLATVHGVVTHHRGWLDVQSDAEQGTTFNLYFPVAPPDVAEG